MPKIKKVMTYSPREKKFRVCRFLWGSGTGNAYFSNSLSLSFWPRIFRFWREHEAWFLTVLGVQLHFKYGGNGCFPD